MRTGWLVDTFGHISQSPQIHRMFGIDTVYVWRGVPQLDTLFQLAGRGRQPAPHHRPLRRLSQPLRRHPRAGGGGQAPATPRSTSCSPTIPTPRHSPLRRLRSGGQPGRSAALLRRTQEIGCRSDLGGIHPGPLCRRSLPPSSCDLPTIRGELNSGKYGATFPGTFSARTYLKVMASDCEALLFQRCEPLARLAHAKGRPYPAAHYEAWSRAAAAECGPRLHLRRQHRPGPREDGVQLSPGFRRHGRGRPGLRWPPSWPTSPPARTRSAPPPSPWTNGSPPGTSWSTCKPTAWACGPWPSVCPSSENLRKSPRLFGKISTSRLKSMLTAQCAIGDSTLGQLVVSAEHGDTYSDEPGQRAGRDRRRQPAGRGSPLRASCGRALLRHVDRRKRQRDRHRAPHLRPVSRGQVADRPGQPGHGPAGGHGLRHGQAAAASWPGMPFDVVERAAVDTDLLPKAVSPSPGQGAPGPAGSRCGLHLPLPRLRGHERRGRERGRAGQGHPLV